MIDPAIVHRHHDRRRPVGMGLYDRQTVVGRVCDRAFSGKPKLHDGWPDGDAASSTSLEAASDRRLQTERGAAHLASLDVVPDLLRSSRAANPAPRLDRPSEARSRARPASPSAIATGGAEPRTARSCGRQVPCLSRPVATRSIRAPGVPGPPAPLAACRAWTRWRCGSTVCRGSRADAMPAAKRPKRVRAEPASSAAPVAAAPPRWRRAIVAAPSAPAALSTLAARRRCAAGGACSASPVEAEAALQQLRGGELAERAEHGHPPGRRVLGGRRGDQRRTGGRCGRRSGEHERKLAARVVPDGDGGVCDQRRGVGRDGGAEHAGADSRGPPGLRCAGEQVAGGCRGAQRRVAGEQPAADAHRRCRFDHAQHVQEPLPDGRGRARARRARGRSRRWPSLSRDGPARGGR